MVCMLRVCARNYSRGIPWIGRWNVALKQCEKTQKYIANICNAASFSYIGHLTEEESFFNYSIGNTSYSAINDGYMDYLPVFTEDLINSVSDNVIAICKNDLNCIYDLSLTGDRNIGLSTYNISLSNSDIIKELCK